MTAGTFSHRYIHPLTEETLPLFSDRPKTDTMFRVVVKSNLTAALVENLLDAFKAKCEFLDNCGPGYAAIHHAKKKATHHANKAC